MDGLMLLAIMVRAVLFCSGMRGVIMDGSRMPDPQLVLDGVEDLFDGEPQLSELLNRLVGSERAQ